MISLRAADYFAAATYSLKEELPAATSDFTGAPVLD
jgi:hypothetical protein